MPTQLVYYFGGGHADGRKEDKELIGGKGANLAEMTRIGLPVPPGFTIVTKQCLEYLKTGAHPQALREQVAAALTRLEKDSGKTFGDAANPLLLSIRSGAASSMPGMMDTILNLGLNDETAEGLARVADNPRFAYDSYRRFIQMFGDVVLGADHHAFEAALAAKKQAVGAQYDMDLSPDDLRDVVASFKRIVQDSTGAPFPTDPQEQLWRAIEAVFRSWNTDRAIHYRRVHGLPYDMGTAVNVQTMVFGNMGETSGTGVAFTRDPSTGEKRFYGEFLLNAQGEDVVAGIRDPLHIDEMGRLLPEQHRELLQLQEVLEKHYRDMQDLEFTVERERLYILQTRNGKRTAAAAVKIAVDMVAEGLISKEEAVLRVDAQQLDQLLHPRLDPKAQVDVLATGLPASPGAASGKVVFDPDAAAAQGEAGEPVILVRAETSPDDFHGMVMSQAIVTARGGMTSHAAVVARGMGKCCVVGAKDLAIDEAAGTVSAGGKSLREGDWITVDGTLGRILIGQVATVPPELSEQFHQVMAWADEFRVMRVRTNADTPADTRKAREFGAEGIGLCRTEHMFFEGDRIFAMREMILAQDDEERRRALAKLLPMQREDFEGIFRAMDGYPVTIRLLDPPLHEFLPHGQEEMNLVAERLGVDGATVHKLVERHRESNPMLGHRGVRLGLSYPQITEMQARAIFEAAVAVAKEGVKVLPEVMVPLIGTVKELAPQKALIQQVADEIIAEAGISLPYLVGTMIELPRAALTAARIAEEAEFFSFGTNDLTQTTFGISRDDAASFLPSYVEAGILPEDPFQSLDIEGVGQLVAMGTREGRRTRPDLKVGICGEHGGEPRSVHFFHAVGLNYVSCSPFRVPVARLAAAQAALMDKVRAQAEEGGKRIEVASTV
jgi:pyruvate, orthophosphate dikinase